MQLKINVPTKLGITLLVCLLIVGTSLVTFLYTKKGFSSTDQQPTPTKEPPKDNRAELDVILSEIRTVMLLTESETPTLVTVTEAEKMRSQSFFKNVENGDKVIIYENAKKAILWRPSTKMIIEVGAVSKESPASPTPSTSKKSTEKKEVVVEGSPTPTP